MSIVFLLRNSKMRIHSMKSINISKKFGQLSINPTLSFITEILARKFVVEASALFSMLLCFLFPLQVYTLLGT